MQKSQAMNPKALSGIKVLDASEYISGPYCAKLLGMFGADVIKVEKPNGGDRARWIGGKGHRPQSCEKSPLYLYLNTHKKGTTLDWETEEGRSLFRKLAARSDVLVENHMPGRLDSLGLGYDTLKKDNAGIVMVSITDFGQTGIYRDYRGGRLVGNAMSGYMYINGEPSREPLAGGGEQPGYQGGINGYIGVLSALLKREKTQKGDYIDVSLMECMAAIHQYTLTRYAYSGKIQKRSGNRHLWTHPVTIYPCRDGYVAISAVTDDQCESLLLMMEKVELLSDRRFSTGRKRLANADAFDELLIPWFKEKSSGYIVDNCMEWRVPASRVNTSADLFSDPQNIARKFFTFVNHPEAGVLLCPSSPFKMSRTPAAAARAPLLGEHNEEIYLGQLGLKTDEFQSLSAKGVI